MGAGFSGSWPGVWPRVRRKVQIGPGLVLRLKKRTGVYLGAQVKSAAVGVLVLIVGRLRRWRGAHNFIALGIGIGPKRGWLPRRGHGMNLVLLVLGAVAYIARGIVQVITRAGWRIV